MGSRTACVLVAAALQCGCTSPQLPRFEAALAAHDSATAALRGWCEAEGIAAPARITAALARDEEWGPPPADLGTLGGSAVSFRRVRLSCGNSTLSFAQNWYARDLLTPEMNRLLDQTDTPFGTATAAVHFRRERLSEARGKAPGCPAGTVLAHRARLVLPDGRPLALLIECYTRENLRH